MLFTVRGPSSRAGSTCTPTQRNIKVNFNLLFLQKLLQFTQHKFTQPSCWSILSCTLLPTLTLGMAGLSCSWGRVWVALRCRSFGSAMALSFQTAAPAKQHLRCHHGDVSTWLFITKLLREYLFFFFFPLLALMKTSTPKLRDSYFQL